jgi:hypothetical protein
MGSGAMLKPTGPNLSRPKIRPGHWGQWLVTGAVGLVGFVVLALLLELGASIDQFDHRVLAAVISAREPNLTLLARAASLLGSAGARVGSPLREPCCSGSERADSCYQLPCWRPLQRPSA